MAVVVGQITVSAMVPSSLLPIISCVSAVGFLCGGAYLGLKQSLHRVHKEEVELLAKRKVLGSSSTSLPPLSPPPPPTVSSLAAQELPGGLKLGQFAARAFMYGTALCMVGGVVGVVGVFWALGVRDAQGFTDRMHELMPGVRTRMVGGMMPTLESVSSGGRSVARAAEGTVGTALRSQVAPLKGQSREEEMKGLSKRDRKTLTEFMEWVEGESKEEEGGKQGQ